MVYGPNCVPYGKGINAESITRNYRESRHSRIQTTLDLYTDEYLDAMIVAQEKSFDAVGFESGSVQWKLWVGCG